MDRSSFAKNTAFQYALQVAKYAFPLLTIPYLTRVFGPDVYAIRAYVLAFMTFTQIFLDYGFFTYGTRAVVQAHSNQETISKITSAICVWRALLCVLGLFVLSCVLPLVPILAQNALYVYIAYVCVCFKAMLPDFVFAGLQDMSIITYRFVASQAVATVLIFLVVQSPSDLIWVPTIEVIAAAIAFAWSWGNVILTRKIPLVKVDIPFLFTIMKPSTLFFLSNTASNIYTSLTTVMVGLLISEEAVISYWSLVTTAVAAIQSLYTPITNSLYPHMVKTHDFELLKKLLIAGMLAVSAGSILFACLAKYEMLLIGGQNYLDGAFLFPLLAPVLWCSYPAMLLGAPVLAAFGKEKQLMISSCAASVFHVVGLVLLAAFGVFAIEHVAILRCMTELFLLCARAFFVYKSYHEMCDEAKQ